MRKFTFHVLAALFALTLWASCGENKSEQMLRESTEIARKRTDSLL